MGQLFEELKRRNVFRVAVAYAVVGWIVMQITDVAVPSLLLPDWVPALVFYLGLIGFPFAMLFAWAFELTPDGVKKTKDADRDASATAATGQKINILIGGALVLALGFIAWDKLAPGSDPTPSPAGEAQANAASIAVLPFVNMSDDKDYFADGLSEELLNLLAKIPGLRVTGRTSSFAFKGRNQDLREIGAALDVMTVLEGSVRRSGARLRVTAQLINVADGYHIWSDTYDRELTEVFEVQDDIAAKIMVALKVHLVGAAPTRGRPTENMEAYQKFLEGRALMLDGATPLEARDLLRAAVALDPGFAEAWEQLAFSNWFLGGSSISSEEGFRLTHAAAIRALAIDPTLSFAAALEVSSNVETYTFAREIRAFEAVLVDNPDHSGSLYALTYALLETGYFADTLPLAKHLTVMEPLSAEAHGRYAEVLRGLGRIDEARAEWQRSVELGSAYSAQFLFIDHMLAGEHDLASAALETAFRMAGKETPDLPARLQAALDPSTGRAAIDTWASGAAGSLEYVGGPWWLYVAFGLHDALFDLIDSKDPGATIWNDADDIIHAASVFHDGGFMAHPGYLVFMRKIGGINIWETRGAPDNCSKNTGEWVCR